MSYESNPEFNSDFPGFEGIEPFWPTVETDILTNVLNDVGARNYGAEVAVVGNKVFMLATESFAAYVNLVSANPETIVDAMNRYAEYVNQRFVDDELVFLPDPDNPEALPPLGALVDLASVYGVAGLLYQSFGELADKAIPASEAHNFREWQKLSFKLLSQIVQTETKSGEA